MNKQTKAEKKDIGYDPTTKHYKLIIDSKREIYGYMACIGCMPSKGGCPIHE